jgi:hypothetical protein
MSLAIFLCLATLFIGLLYYFRKPATAEQE